VDEDRHSEKTPVVWARHCWLVTKAACVLLLSFVFVIAFVWLTSKGSAGESIANVLGLYLIIGLHLFYAMVLGVFLGSLISLIGLLVKKEHTRKPYFHAILSLLVCMTLFLSVSLAVIYSYRTSKHNAMEFLCQSRLKELYQALQTYCCQTDGNLPPGESWCDILVTSQMGASSLRCISDNNDSALSSYAMNRYLPESIDGIPENLVLFFESDLGWNGVGGPEDIAIDRHVNAEAGCFVLFADGTVSYVIAADIPLLRWRLNDDL
jgi:hypothetical protein